VFQYDRLCPAGAWVAPTAKTHIPSKLRSDHIYGAASVCRRCPALDRAGYAEGTPVSVRLACLSIVLIAGKSALGLLCVANMSANRWRRTTRTVKTVRALAQGAHRQHL